MRLSRAYSPLDRALHHVAFLLPFAQRALGELESDLYRRQLAGITSRDEVFVTGVARAGTTLVLGLLHGTGEFASFTYREMPFILSPLLWQRISASSRRPGTLVERAHGDGVQVSYDSPEAFDEVAWLAFLGDRILRERTLAPVPAGALTPEAVADLQTLVRKLLLASSLRDGGRGGQLRYLSKNNANISRLEALERVFPTARVLVVFRDPLAHVASLMAQHRRFLAVHAEDPFSRRYMRWVGHYEFGANFRPIDFDGRFGRGGVPGAADAAFWLGYWTTAYGHALASGSKQLQWVDFDSLRKEPVAALERLADQAGIQDRAQLASAVETLRAPTTQPLPEDAVPESALSAARDIYRRLLAAAA